MDLNLELVGKQREDRQQEHPGNLMATMPPMCEHLYGPGSLVSTSQASWHLVAPPPCEVVVVIPALQTDPEILSE